MLWRYMTGAVAARTGDEMSGPALLVAGLAVTGSPVAASWLLAGLTVSAAVGGPLLGVLLDRARRPGRLLACCLTGYAAGLLLVLSGLGRVPEALLVGVAVATGLLGPALTGGWTAQLPLVTGPERLGRATALDAMTYNVAGLAGPAVVGALAAAGGATHAMLACVALLAAALPIAWALPPRPGTNPTDRSSTARSPTGARPSDRRPRGTRPPVEAPAAIEAGASGGGRSVRAELVAGFAVIVRNPPLRRATAGSMISCAGLAMLVVATPVLGVRLTGESGHGALLLAVMAACGLAVNALLATRAPARAGSRARAGRDAARWWDRVLAGGTAVLGAGMVLAAVSETFWVAVAAAAVAGAGEGPQLTALFSVRHREAPALLRSQVFTTAASLKITSYAFGSALAGPLAAYTPGAALLAGAALQAVAVAVLFPRR
ncbi:MFS transporter [Nonomuraea sp. KC401]|uniref:MFS transporter n=1 Tax=unclassified Nonomuraea TaxID=2593643 RepID=UPI0010FDD78B|nr:MULTISPECIES: MFS transporter [unclassified Nonomuraea]NBE94544.1 MFS transporter [Nonomuraea sp. K271]TLF76393.1 MFS transporter [Nonomuraea sp. KC401]